MLGTKVVPDKAVYLLADHLDAALAAGEDLLAVTLSTPVEASPGEASDRVDALDMFVGRLARHEASVIARVLQARRRADALDKVDPLIQPLVKLFLANTNGVLALVDRFGDKARVSFEGASGVDAFLRGRGLVESDVASLASLSTISVTERYRLMTVVELGPLLDLVSTFLEALDRHYDLYQDDAAVPAVPPIEVTADDEADEVLDTAQPLEKSAVRDAAPPAGETGSLAPSEQDKADTVEAPASSLTAATLAEALAAVPRAN